MERRSRSGTRQRTSSRIHGFAGEASKNVKARIRKFAFSCSSALVLACSLAACRSSENAVLRGDRYWADSNYTAALAEYRLAARQSGSDPNVSARVAHAYIRSEERRVGKEGR